MLRDDRVRGLATEFGGNWLDFRRFEELNSVDRERFPEFTNELREAMFEEPIRFFVDLVQRDGSVLDFLYANYTFVNAACWRSIMECRRSTARLIAGRGLTTPIALSAAGCCRWPCSSRRTRRGCERVP